MSYLEEFKTKVIEEQAKTIEVYKLFMEDFVLCEAAQSSTCNVFVNHSDYKEQFIKSPFINWLEKEGFTVTEPSNDGNLLIQFT
jgi:hypothetical protein